MTVTRRRGMAISAAFALFAVLLPMTFASADANADNTVRLAMANGTGTFTYQDADPSTSNVVQSFTASKKCAPTPTGSLMSWAAAGGSVGFSTHALGVNAPGEGNSGKCEQVNVPDQILTLKTGSALAGKTFDFAELDLEAKFDAAINIRIFNGPTQVDASPDDAGTMDLVITCTSAGSDCGPDDSARDNFRERVPSSGLQPFTEIWLWATATNTSGAVALEGGADGTLPLEGGLGAAIGTSDTIFHVTPATALSVTKKADDGNDTGTDPSTSESVSIGDPVGYTVEVKNTGADAAYAVSLTDTLPTEAGTGTSWSISDAGGKCSPTNTSTTPAAIRVTCAIPTLAPGASYSFHVSATTSASGALSNIASASAANAANSSGSATISVLAPGLSVTKTAEVSTDGGETWSPSSDAIAGDLIRFAITVANASGAGTATGVNLTDELPTAAGPSWVDDSDDCSITGPDGVLVLSCSIGTLAADSSFSVHVTLTTPAATGLVTNSATVVASHSDPVSSGEVSIEVWQGLLGCPSIAEEFDYQAWTTGEGTAAGALSRLENVTGDCEPKPYLFESQDEELNVIRFTPGYVEGQETAQYVMEIDWGPREPTTATQTYTTTIAGRTTEIQYSATDPWHAIQWCTSVTYDGADNVVTAERPYRVDPGYEGQLENWCLVSQNAVQQSDGKVALTEVLYGYGDPNVRG